MALKVCSLNMWFWKLRVEGDIGRDVKCGMKPRAVVGSMFLHSMPRLTTDCVRRSLKDTSILCHFLRCFIQ